jgi:hypothetical protein
LPGLKARRNLFDDIFNRSQGDAVALVNRRDIERGSTHALIIPRSLSGPISLKNKGWSNLGFDQPRYRLNYQ